MYSDYGCADLCFPSCFLSFCPSCPTCLSVLSLTGDCHHLCLPASVLTRVTGGCSPPPRCPPHPRLRWSFPCLLAAMVASVLWPSSAGLVLGIGHLLLVLRQPFWINCSPVLSSTLAKYRPLFFFFCPFATRPFTNPLVVIPFTVVSFWVLLLWAPKTTANAITAPRRLRIKLTIGAIAFSFFVVLCVLNK